MFVPFLGLLCTAFGEPLATPHTPEIKFDIKKTMQVIEGVSIGFFLDDKITIIEPCLSEFSHIEPMVRKIFSYLKVHSPSSSLKALSSIADALESVPVVIEKCGATKKQVDLMLDTLTTFRNPLKFFYFAGKNILINGKEIYNELKVAKKMWSEGDWVRFGYQIGFAMHKVALGYGVEYKPVGSVELNSEGAKDIVIGLARGLFLEGVEIKESCVKDARDLSSRVQNALAYFKKRNREDALKGLVELAKVMELTNLALKECDATKEHLSAVEKAITIIKNPRKFMYVIGKHFVVNDHEIFHELSAVVDDWKLEEFQAFGFQLGLVCNELLVDEIAPPKPATIEESQSLVEYF